MSSRGTGRVVRARMTPPRQGQLYPTIGDWLKDVLRSGLKDERYGRVWHLGQVQHGDDYLYGRLGFQRVVDVDLWSDDMEDFENSQIPNGAVAPFAIRLSDLALVYQTRKQEIRPISFNGALKSMLKDGSHDDWRITTLNGGGVAFDEWRSTVDYVTRIRFRVERVPRASPPTSGTVGRLTAPGADIAFIGWRAEAGLNTDTDLIRELTRQVTAGIGEIVADGRCAGAATAVRRWSSELGDESVTSDVQVRETGEADISVLLEQLAMIPALPEPL